MPTRLPGAVRAPDWLMTYRLALLRADIVLVMVAVLIASLAPWSGLGGAVVGSSIAGLDWLFAAGLIAGWLACLAAEGAWDLDAVGSGLTECRRILLASAVVFAVVGILGYVTQADLARGYLLIAVPLGVAGLLANHLVRRSRLLVSRGAGNRLLSVLVVGDRAGAAGLCARLRDEPRAGYRAIGVCVPLDRSELPGPVAGLPVRGDLNDVAAAALECGANAVAVAGSGLAGDRVSQLAWRLEGTGVGLLVAPEMVDIAGPRIRVRQVAGLPLLRISEPRLDGARAVLKATLDVVGSLLGIVLLSPFMLLALIAVPVADGGPALTRREFVGRGGRLFHAWTFRCVPHGSRSRRSPTDATIPDAGDPAGPDLTGGHRQPMTAVGRILRRTGLDESPLLFDALVGGLSLVGPKPGVSGTADEFVRRPQVRPGITGPWRVSRTGSPAGSPGVPDDPSMEFRYVENWSLTGDVAIIAQTVSAVVKGRAVSWSQS